MQKLPKKTFGPVGWCIYCGSTKRLSTEHIIPYGLGGNLELLSSSCDVCAGITSAFELVCLRHTFLNLRVKHKLPTRRPKNRPQSFSIMLGTGNEEYREKLITGIELPYKQWALPVLDYPTLISQVLSKNEAKILCVLDAQSAENLLGFGDGIHPVKAPQMKISLNALYKLLAKIAHSYAYAKLPSGSFTPILGDLILQKDFDKYNHLIGGELDIPEPSPYLYELSIGKTKAFNGIECIAVRIRLFSYLGTPVYIVAVGFENGKSINIQNLTSDYIPVIKCA